MKSRRNKSNKFVALILAFVMITLTLAGCRKSGGDADDGTKDGYVYVPEYIQIDFGLNNEDMYISDTAAVADSLYLIVSSWGENGSEYGLYKYSFSDGKTERLPLELGENDYVSRMTATPEGNLVAVINHNTYDMDDNGEVTNYSSTLELRLMSAEDGSIINSQDITSLISEENPYIQQFVVDAKGNYYFYNSDQNITIADSNLQKKGDINIGDWINSMVVSKEGDVYISNYGESGLELKKVEPDTKSVGEKLEGIKSGWGNQRYYGGISKSILISSDEVSLYDIASASEERLFTWLDMDVNNNYIDNVGELSDGRIWAVYNDYDTESSKPEVLIIKKVEAAKVTKKEEISYGTVGLDWDMKRLIINFNKTNEKYRIVVKEYGTEDYQTGITQFNADLTTANCPDIVDLSSLNYTMYASKGVLEDLYPYMEKSGLKKEDYLENVLTAYEVDGKLCAMVSKFYVTTIMAKQSMVGNINGWTLSEMLDFVEDNNPENIFDYGDRNSIFYYCIYNNIDEFIDWETGKCSFDGEDFIRILEFAAKFPSAEEINWSDREGIYSRLKADKVLLLQSTISSVQNYQMYKGMFGEQIAFVGYPNNERSGNMIQPSGGCVGISAKSKNKDGAWEFLQAMINKEYQENMKDNWGFPIMKSALEKKFEEDMTPEYYEDENGEQVETMKTSWGYDDFDIDIYAATQEEIDEVWELIQSVNKVSGNVADEQLTNIITEETEAFFKGQKSAADAAAVIQNRIQIYVNENR